MPGAVDQPNANLRRSWRRCTIVALLAAIVFALVLAWRLTFYTAGLSGAAIGDAFPLVNDVSKAIAIARTHPAAPFLIHGAAGAIAMVSGAIQFILILQGHRSRWHAVLGRTYALAALVASATACIIAWSLSRGGLPTSVAYTIGGLAWGGATIVAVLAVRAGDHRRHVRWIVRSYAYLLLVVTARLMFMAFGALGLYADENFPWDVVYGLMISAAFAINFAVAEWIVRKLGAVEVASMLRGSLDDAKTPIEAPLG